MDYKKIIKDEYTLHLANTDRFKCINLIVVFTKEYEKDNRKYYVPLCDYLSYSTKKYNTLEKISIKKEELYGLSTKISYESVCNLERLEFKTSFLNPKYTEEKYYNESIDFLFEMLLNPNIKDNHFDKDIVNMIKKDISMVINSKKDNPYKYAGIEFNKIFNKGNSSEYDVLPTIEELNTVNETNLCNFYKNLFNGKYKIDVIFFGDIDEKKSTYIDNKIKNLKGNNIKFSIDLFKRKETKVIEKIDTLHFNQSKLYLGYNLIDLTEHELRYVIKIYNTILGTMNDSILFNIVREQNSLCYNIGSYYSRYNNGLVIYAGINKNNYEKTVELIKECVESMSDSNVINKYINSAKQTFNTYLNSFYDDIYSQIDKVYISEFETQDDIEILREKVNKITVEEIIELNKKIKLSVIYLLRGDNE